MEGTQGVQEDEVEGLGRGGKEWMFGWRPLAVCVAGEPICRLQHNDRAAQVLQKICYGTWLAELGGEVSDAPKPGPEHLQ
jgi:hypothetical protein